jgi:hypothetical protein
MLGSGKLLSEYGGIPLNGQSLWVPNQAVLGSMYQVMPGSAQQQSGVGHSPGMYSDATAFVHGAAYQYGQAMVGNSPMAPGWACRVSSGDMPSLMTPRRNSLSSNENDIPGTPYCSSALLCNVHLQTSAVSFSNPSCNEDEEVSPSQEAADKEPFDCPGTSPAAALYRASRLLNVSAVAASHPHLLVSMRRQPA